MHGINEFSRSRKRISIVVRKNGVGWIFVKGVDSTMLELGQEDTDFETLAN